MDGVVGEAGEGVGGLVDVNFCFLGAGGFGEMENVFDDATKFGFGEQLRGVAVRLPAAEDFGGLDLMLSAHWFEKAEPILTLRKRDGDAPWPVPIVCMGWPLPQLGVPQSVQCRASRSRRSYSRIPW